MRNRPLVFLVLIGFFAGQAEAAAGGAPFLWSVKGPKATHYLMGSVHLLPSDAYPLPDGLDAAYAQTAQLMLETDPGALDTPEVQMQMMGRGASPEGIQRDIPGALYDRVRQQAERLAMPVSLCDGFKPWFCALTLGVLSYQREGMDPALGLDLHYYQRALQDQRPIRWFESAAQQIDLFGGMSEPMSKDFLASTLDELAGAEQNATQLVGQWRANDVPAIAATVADMKTEFPEAYSRLLAARNRAWTSALVNTIDGDTPVLVVVGAAHLVGPEGLVKLLTARGYEVKQVADLALPAAVAPEAAAPVEASSP